MHRFRDGKHATYVDVARTFSRKLSAVVVARCKTADDTLRHLNRGPACCAFSFLEVDSTLVGLAVVVVVVDEEEDNDDEDDGHDEDDLDSQRDYGRLSSAIISRVASRGKTGGISRRINQSFFFSFLFFSQRFNTSATNLWWNVQVVNIYIYIYSWSTFGLNFRWREHEKEHESRGEMRKISVTY